MQRASWIPFLVAVAIASNAQAVVSDPPTRYTVQVSGMSFAPYLGRVQGMNASGQITYWKNPSPNWYSGYFWNGNQSVQLSPTTGYDVITQGLNNAGVVAGFWGPLNFSSTAAYWDQSGKHDLPGLGGNYSWAQAINNDGVIAGRSETGVVNIQRHLVIWDGVTHDHGSLPTFYDQINGMNNARQIIGVGAGDLNGWVWQNGQYRFLNDLQGGHDAEPFAITEDGTAIGMSWPQQTNGHAVRWAPSATTPQLLALPPAATGSSAYSINNEGDVVGFLVSPDHTSGVAVLWRGSNYYALGDLIDSETNWELTEAWNINDAGQILALARTEATGWRELLLTPVPEPAGAVIFTTLLTASLRRRRAY